MEESKTVLSSMPEHGVGGTFRGKRNSFKLASFIDSVLVEINKTGY